MTTYNRVWRAQNAERYKQAQRKYTLRKLYNITPEEFDVMAKAQDHKCFLCRKLGKRLVVDHNHITGKVRGLLCHQCNIGVGGFENMSRRIGPDKLLEYLFPKETEYIQQLIEELKQIA